MASSPTRIQSVSRATRMLLWISEHADGCPAQLVAKEFALSLPTTYHLLNTLVAEGLLAKDSRRRYLVGPKVAALADAFMRQNHAPEYLLTPLRELAAATGETAYLSAWRGEEIRILAVIEGVHAVRVAGLYGSHYGNGHARATGKLLLAFARPQVREAYLRANPPGALTRRTIVDPSDLDQEFDRIRRRGYAYDEEEFADGVRCISAPVIENRVVTAALTISAPASRFKEFREPYTRTTVDAARAATTASREAAQHTA